MRHSLRAERALGTSFEIAWRGAFQRCLIGTSREERHDWKEALNYARPIFRDAYEGRELPLAVQAIPELAAALDETDDRPRSRGGPPPVTGPLTAAQRARMRETGVLGGRGALPGPKPRQRRRP